MTSTLPPATHVARGTVGAVIRDEFPILATTTYLNSCSQGALSQPRAHRVRGISRRLGRERRGVGALGRARRERPGRVCSVARGDACRGRRDHLGVPGRERHRQRPRPAQPSAHRHLRVRVSDDRPDRARAGASRRRDRPRPSRLRRLDPPRALGRGDRRANVPRLLHGDLVSHRPSSGPRGDRWRSRTNTGRSCSPTAIRRPARSISTSASSAWTS